MKLTCRGIEWIGRHYLVSDGQKCRPYTNCTSIAQESVTYRKNMVEHFLQALNKTQTEKIVLELPEFIDYLPFCVKQYEGPTALSKKLVSAGNLDYTIEGPIGRGLEIHPNFSGHAILVAGGTGILPFLDLLEFLLKKVVYEKCKLDGLDTSFILPQQDYSAFFPGASFTLLGAFGSVDDFVGLEIVSDLYGICQKLKLDFFDAAIRVKGLAVEHGIPTTDSHFTSEWLKQFVKSKDDSVLICGPPAMQEELRSSFVKDLSVGKEKIIFV